MIYRPKKPTLITAFKFEKKEDIPEELPSFTMFSYPGMSYDQTCPNCGKPWLDHGMFNGNPICPHQYVLYKNNKITSLMGVETFEDIYISLCNEDAIIREVKKDGNN